MDLNLRGRRALDHRLVQGHRPCDRALARRRRLPCAARGAHQVRTRRAAARTSGRSFGVEAAGHAADLSDGASVKVVAAAAGDVDILVNSAGAIPRGTRARDRRGALAQGLGPQAVRRHQPDARNLSGHVRARPWRDHQHRRHRRRTAGRLLHRRKLRQRGADHVLALARRRQHPSRRARAGGQSRSGRDRKARSTTPSGSPRRNSATRTAGAT